MKKLFIIVIFMIFFNIFCFMFAWFGIFPAEYETDTGSIDVNTTGSMQTPGEQYINTMSDGLTFGNIVSIFLGRFDSLSGFLASIVLIAGAVAASVLMHTPAPLVIGFVGTFVKNLYLNASEIFARYPVNNYFMMAFGAGMLILFVITIAEYLTHGDA